MNNTQTTHTNNTGIASEERAKLAAPLIPQLRFQEFEKEWNEKILGQFASFSKGKNISKIDIVENGEFECIRYGELYTEYYEVIQSIKSRTNLPLGNLILSEENDVIMPSSGETQIDIATASCVTKKGIALGGDLNIIKTDEDGLFLAYCLNGKKKFDIAKLAQGNSVVHLYNNHLKGLKLNLPTFPEQQKIAGFLTAVDTKLQQLNRKKDLLEQYKKGVMQQLFSQQLRFKKADGSDYTDWDLKLLSEIVSIKSKKYNPKVDSDNPKCIELEHLEQETGRILGYEMAKNLKSTKSRFAKGDVLFGKLRPYLRKFAMADFHGVCTSEIWVLKSIKIYDQFTFYLIQTDKFMNLAEKSAGSKMPRAVWNVISSETFLIPCEEEQQKIANYLSALDTKIETVTQQIEKTQAFKKGLLQQLFV